MTNSLACACVVLCHARSISISSSFFLPLYLLNIPCLLFLSFVVPHFVPHLSVRNRVTNEVVALKKLRLTSESTGFHLTSLREISILKSLKHPNVIEMKEVVVGKKPDYVFLVFEQCAYDLATVIDKTGERFSQSEIKTLMLQLLSAVAYLHKRFIIHRDIKLSNLLLTSKGVLKLGDFGLARQTSHPLRPMTPNVYTLWYRAPELLLHCGKWVIYSPVLLLFFLGLLFLTLNASVMYDCFTIVFVAFPFLHPSLPSPFHPRSHRSRAIPHKCGHVGARVCLWRARAQLTASPWPQGARSDETHRAALGDAQCRHLAIIDRTTRLFQVRPAVMPFSYSLLCGVVSFSSCLDSCVAVACTPPSFYPHSLASLPFPSLSSPPCACCRSMNIPEQDYHTLDRVFHMLSPEGVDLISRMLVYDPSRVRITYASCKKAKKRKKKKEKRKKTHHASRAQPIDHLFVCSFIRILSLRLQGCVRSSVLVFLIYVTSVTFHSYPVLPSFLPSVLPCFVQRITAAQALQHPWFLENPPPCPPSMMPVFKLPQESPVQSAQAAPSAAANPPIPPRQPNAAAAAVASQKQPKR